MIDDNALLRTQQALEENEDLIASIVENLQLRRLKESLAQYSVLHKNLVTMALALDNYPADDTDPYEACHIFPDEIMRKDILDELKPADSYQVTKAPLPPPCQKCALLKLSSEQCRREFDHVDLNSKFSDSERIDFLHVTQVLEVRHRQRKPDGTKSSAIKRSYRRWTSHEKYTVSVAMALFGEKNYRAIASVLCDRTIEQIRSFIIKSFTAEDKVALASGSIPPAPADYDPPRSLLSNRLFLKDNPRFIGLAAERCVAPSLLTPKQGINDWTSLLGIANGLTASSSPAYHHPDASYHIPSTTDPMALGSPHAPPHDNRFAYHKSIPKITTITLSDIPDMLYNFSSSLNEPSSALTCSLGSLVNDLCGSTPLLSSSAFVGSAQEDTAVGSLPSCPKHAPAMPAPLGLVDALSKRAPMTSPAPSSIIISSAGEVPNIGMTGAATGGPVIDPTPTPIVVRDSTTAGGSKRRKRAGAPDTEYRGTTDAGADKAGGGDAAGKGAQKIKRSTGSLPGSGGKRTTVSVDKGRRTRRKVADVGVLGSLSPRSESNDSDGKDVANFSCLRNQTTQSAIVHDENSNRLRYFGGRLNDSDECYEGAEALSNDSRVIDSFEDSSIIIMNDDFSLML